MRNSICKTIGSIISIILVSLIFAGGAGYCQQPPSKHIDIQSIFTPSGWMGDGEYGRKYIEFSGADKTNPYSPPTSIKVSYQFGPARWAGIYWQNKPDNWGDKPGNNYAGKGFSKILFWARGETGNEVVEFKFGDIDNPLKKYRDSFGVTLGRVRLSNTWQQYQMDLTNADLSSVIGGFCWVASADYNEAKTDNLPAFDFKIKIAVPKELVKMLLERGSFGKSIQHVVKG